MEAWGLLLEVIILLTGCLLAGAVCSALKQSPIVGYLLAGMVLGGPGSLHLIHSEANIEAIAELGVALLLFSIGLEFSWKRLVGLGGSTLGAGTVQVVLTACCAGAGLLLFGLSLAEAVALGAMVSLSSTAAVLRILIDNGEIDSMPGRNSLAILLVQDMAVVPLAVLMTLLSGSGGPTEIALDVLKITGLALALVVGLYLLLGHGTAWLLNRLSVEKNRELTVLLAIVAGLGATWAAHAIGLSPALGAFLAGMFLGSSPFATQIRADVSSLRVVLLTLFFGAVGMVADPLWMAEHLPLILGCVALLIVLKTTVIWLIFRMLGQPDGIGVASGLCLAQIGEFAFVLGTTAKAGGVLTDEHYMMLVSTAIVTLFATPALVALAPRAAVWVRRWKEARSPGSVPQSAGHQGSAARPAPDVVIVGFGPAGRLIAQALVGQPVNVLILDLNAGARRPAEALGFRVEIGDATSADVLHHLHVEQARIVAITIPSRAAALTILDTVRQLNPTATIIIRSRYQLHEAEFAQAGADHVIGDEQEVGHRLAIQVQVELSEGSSAEVSALSLSSVAD